MTMAALDRALLCLQGRLQGSGGSPSGSRSMRRRAARTGAPGPQHPARVAGTWADPFSGGLPWAETPPAEIPAVAWNSCQNGGRLKRFPSAGLLGGGAARQRAQRRPLGNLAQGSAEQRPRAIAANPWVRQLATNQEIEPDAIWRRPLMRGLHDHSLKAQTGGSPRERPAEGLSQPIAASGPTSSPPG